MGNKKTKECNNIECIKTPPEKKLKAFALLGAGFTGKSVFMEQLTKPYISHDKFKTILTWWFLSLPDEFLEKLVQICENEKHFELTKVMIETCRYFIGTKDQIFLPVTEILTMIYNHTELWRVMTELERAENIELLIRKCQSGEEYFNPFIYFAASTCFSIERRFTLANESYLAYTSGGQRTIRKSWMNILEYGRTVLLFASLSEFNQTLYEDPNENRMNDSLLVYSEMESSRYQVRMILILSKPDILLRKLKNGIEYDRELCYCIRPELEKVSTDYNLKIIVNSIVNEFSKRISKKEKFRYHIVNSLNHDEVIETMTRIIQSESEKSQVGGIEPFISPSLLTRNYCYSKLKDHSMGMYTSLVDMQVITQ